MKNIFHMGGPLFMGILTTLFLLMLVYSVISLIAILNSKDGDILKVRSRLAHIKAIGLFSAITGIFGQLIGLYEAFSMIEKAMDISPAIIIGGIKISMITPLYGIVIYLISIAIWLVLDLVASKKE